MSSLRKLHLGGKEIKEGWEIFNAIEAEGVDHLGNANDLSRFDDNTFDELYASHILEHFDYKDELQIVLKEWFRVLKPGGTISVSVPDLDQLCHILLQKDKLTVDEQFHIMRMIFGGHTDQYDYHLVGLNQSFLGAFLSQTGFVNIRRVGDFDYFNDTSRLRFKGVAISLNMTAEKPNAT